MKPHIEITHDTVDSHKSAHLMCKGWVETTEGVWTKTNAFDANNMTTDDAYKLQCTFDNWEKDIEK